MMRDKTSLAKIDADAERLLESIAADLHPENEEKVA